MRRYLLVGAVLLTTAIPGSAGPVVVDDYLIVPGKRTGVVSLGMSADAAITRMKAVHGILASRKGLGRGESLCWSSVRICALFIDGRAASVNTTNPKYRTKEGVRVGMAYHEARRRMGRPGEGYDRTPYGDLAYWRGLEVEISKSGIIMTLAVNPFTI